MKNYRPVTLLSIPSKIFEKCIYDAIYSYFEDHLLFSPCQSGFRAKDSCISQLLSITHEIFSSFDANPSIDTRGVFLDISKAFDKVWHDGLIYKLQMYGIGDPLLSLLRDFLRDRLQRVVLNGKESTWEQILAGVPQGSILGPLLFLIYINDLPDGLESMVKIFADDTSIFSTVDNPTVCADRLNRDLGRIKEWARQWKMSFNPDPSKSAVEVYFSQKNKPPQPPPLVFNGTVVSQEESQKHLGVILDRKLAFSVHLEEKISKANKGIGLLFRLRSCLPRRTLLDIYRAFVRPHLDYGDILYDNPGNMSFVQRMETIQYNAALAITGCIRGTSRDKLYSELGLESLSDRRFCRRLCFFYKIVNGHLPSYLRNYIPNATVRSYSLRSRPPVPTMVARTERFCNTFFPFCLSQWNKLDCHIRDLPTVASFKRALLKFYRPLGPPDYRINDPRGLTLLTRLRVGFSHLSEHKFRHNFQDILDPFCSCRTNSIETTEHYLLQCPNFSNERSILFSDLSTISMPVAPYKSDFLCRILLYGNTNLTDGENRAILSYTIKYITATSRFSGSLFN